MDRPVECRPAGGLMNHAGNHRGAFALRALSSDELENVCGGDDEYGGSTDYGSGSDYSASDYSSNDYTSNDSSYGGSNDSYSGNNEMESANDAYNGGSGN